MRVGERGEGKWKEVSWDEAYTFIATKLNEIKNFKNILETLDEKTNNKYDYVNNFMSFASSSYFKDKEENPSEVKEEPKDTE
jgi:anaerobic selenocysteine-containing dehydrogenase